VVQAGDPPFDRIGIVGTGLIGGSIALAARRVWPGVQVLGTPSRSGPLPDGMLDQTLADVAAVAESADLVVLAVPVTAMPRLMHQIARSGSRAVVTDVGSTKRGVMEAARDAGLRSFIGGHPMAGAERPGAAEARADLFVGRPWLLVSGTGGAEAEARFERFVQALGAVTRWMEAANHDRTVAYVSHLPQLVATALMNAAERAVAADGPHVAGNAFAEMTRLASSPADLWQGICEQNADYLAEALAAFAAELPDDVALHTTSAVHQALERSGQARRRWRQNGTKPTP
jgi:prephenate dehydrogenase